LEDADSVIVHQQGSHVGVSNANANINNTNNPYASSASLGGVNAVWGSPGAGSSGSARGDSPMSMAQQQQQQQPVVVAVVGGDDDVVGGGGGGGGEMEEMELGEVEVEVEVDEVEVEVESGKRKR